MKRIVISSPSIIKDKLPEIYQFCHFLYACPEEVVEMTKSEIERILEYRCGVQTLGFDSGVLELFLEYDGLVYFCAFDVYEDEEEDGFWVEYITTH